MQNWVGPLSPNWLYGTSAVISLLVSRATGSSWTTAGTRRACSGRFQR
jgi:Na+/H+ antiporter NhaC